MFERAVARRGKVSEKAAAEKCWDTGKIKCGREKTRLEIEQVEKFQEHCGENKANTLTPVEDMEHISISEEENMDQGRHLHP